MRYLILFMFMVAIFVVGRRSFPFVGRIKAEGPVRAETRSVPDFHAVRLDVAGKVTVRRAETYSVVVHAQESVLPKLKTEVKDGELRIFIDGLVWMDGEIQAEVAGPSFDGLTLAGSGEINMLDSLQTEKLRLEISGAGDIAVARIAAGSVDAQVSGSGTIKLSGTAHQLFANINGSGDLLGQDLAVDRLNADISGSGSVRCAVKDEITGSVSGSGDILYTGDPSRNVQVSGSGNVERVGG